MKHYKKIILDTNVLLYDPEVINEIKNAEIIIPIVVLDELDVKKTKENEIGRNARKIIRALDDLRKKGSLYNGVEIENGSKVRIEIHTHYDKMPSSLVDKKADNKILSIAAAENEKRGDVVVVTKDINLRVKCDALNIAAEDYKRNDVSNISDVYVGWTVVEKSSEIIDQFHADGRLDIEGLIDNQFVLLKNGDQSGLGIYKNNELKKVVDHTRVYGIKPKNKEQKFALNLLLDPNIKLVTLTGSSGTGKTLASLAAGLQQTLDGKEYMRLVISKPNQPMGGKSRDLGFLPGSVMEKMEPWIAPFKDNLEFIFSGNDYEQYINSGIITIEALTYMRGRSIPNSFIIVDECQNLMPKEIKAIVTRVGFGSKIVLLGDISQIDNVFLDFASNGLTAAIEAFKGNEIYGHVTLTKGERSDLATLASKLL